MIAVDETNGTLTYIYIYVNTPPCMTCYMCWLCSTVLKIPTDVSYESPTVLWQTAVASQQHKKKQTPQQQHKHKTTSQEHNDIASHLKAACTTPRHAQATIMPSSRSPSWPSSRSPSSPSVLISAEHYTPQVQNLAALLSPHLLQKR